MTARGTENRRDPFYVSCIFCGRKLELAHSSSAIIECPRCGRRNVVRIQNGKLTMFEDRRSTVRD